jgi:hypothetical protein
MERTNKIIAIIGTRNTGKTTKMIGDGERVGLLAKQSMQKILIVDTFAHPAYANVPIIHRDDLPRWNPKGSEKSYMRIVADDMPDDFTHTFAALVAHCTDTAIVIEDAMKFTATNALKRSLKFLMGDSKQKNNDIYFMYHALAMVPPDIFRLLNFIQLCKTNDTLQDLKRMQKLPNNQEVTAAYTALAANPDQYASIWIQISE